MITIAHSFHLKIIDYRALMEFVWVRFYISFADEKGLEYDFGDT